MPRLRLWLVVVPLAVAGTQAGTALLDRFAGASYEGAELFSRRNASAVLLPPAVTLALALVMVALLSVARSPSAGRPVPRWAFASLPLALFVVQEHAEWALGHHQAPVTLALHPMFAAGLALQLPLAVLSYVLARLLIRVASAIGGRRAHRAMPMRPPSVLRPAREAPLRTLLAAAGRSTRGPPVPISL